MQPPAMSMNANRRTAWSTNCCDERPTGHLLRRRRWTRSSQRRLRVIGAVPPGPGRLGRCLGCRRYSLPAGASVIAAGSCTGRHCGHASSAASRVNASAARACCRAAYPAAASLARKTATSDATGRPDTVADATTRQHLCDLPGAPR